MIKELTNGLSWWTIEAESYYWPEISTQTWSTPHTKGFSKKLCVQILTSFYKINLIFQHFYFFFYVSKLKICVKKINIVGSKFPHM